jgi:AcrR family transcriptional regulator
MDDETRTDARERVLLVAERLFAQRGYAAVTLRDIAAEVGIRHASLYYHAPGGKEELFMEVIERHFARHHAGITGALAAAAPDVRAQLHAIAGWLISQPPMDLLRMLHTDIPSLAPEHARRLSSVAFASTIEPIARVLELARQRHEIKAHNPYLIGGVIVSMVESLHAIPADAIAESLHTLAAEVIDTLLDGLRTRAEHDQP